MSSSAGNVPLSIEFIDPPGDLDVGEKLRFRVVSQGAVGQGHNIEVQQLDFLFNPIMWGQVEATDDPDVGLLRVIELIETSDIYAQPDYSISAVLKARGATVLKPKRLSRMAPRRVEIELIFLHGYGGNFERYDPLTGVQPLDPARAFRLDSDTQQVVIRNGRVFLQSESLGDLVTRVDCKLPNGETVSCDIGTLIESGAAWQSSEPGLYAQYEQKLASQHNNLLSTACKAVRIPDEDFHALVELPEAARIIQEPPVPLTIDFIDSPGDLAPGEEIRFKVRLDEQLLDMRHLHVEFHPIVWATFEPTGDPRIGCLRVLDLPRPVDIYERPEYRLDISLRAHGSVPLRPRRYTRLITGPVEVELVFFRGHGSQFELFNPLTAQRKLDITHAFRLSTDRHRMIEREGRIYLQCDRILDMKTQIDVTLPNGENLQLDLNSRIESGTLWNENKEVYTQSTTQTPKRAPAMPETPEGAEERLLRDRIRLLKAFILSFHSRKGQPDSPTTEKIRSRIYARVKQTRNALRQYQGPAEQDFLRLFQLAIESIPDYLRMQNTTDKAPSID
jgi:hypothetical protein